ncbi:hypothetical protein [Roseateles saccharophilus]|uniref:Uncharacterized protein n=1 Tax=Roseateles saccharophilus TaxID=304 RepID=A0A4R3VKG3_ROSSA|nr:hypothetical protein [Roseateles saccharophilus]MDG0831277.1 hypothetical protein [Roseateles saccharophilus]TCV04402.1 hypothetical protein EV671_1001157 [Roseateles saccharophilus]
MATIQATKLPPVKSGQVAPAIDTVFIDHPIVRRAFELAGKHPDWTGLQVLDVAMNGHVETPPDFETMSNDNGYIDWLSPPSPFAHLLKAAFAPNLTEEAFDARSDEWHEVIDAFGSRYRLWR